MAVGHVCLLASPAARPVLQCMAVRNSCRGRERRALGGGSRVVGSSHIFYIQHCCFVGLLRHLILCIDVRRQLQSVLESMFWLHCSDWPELYHGKAHTIYQSQAHFRAISLLQCCTCMHYSQSCRHCRSSSAIRGEARSPTGPIISD